MLARQIPAIYHQNLTNTQHTINNTCTHELADITFTTVAEVEKIIDCLKTNTSTGIDGISAKVVKSSKKLISSTLVKCINKCLNGEFSQTILK